MCYRLPVDPRLQHLVSELLDDGVWPREILDLLSCWLTVGADEEVLDALTAWMRDERGGGSLNSEAFPAFRLRTVNEEVPRAHDD